MPYDIEQAEREIRANLTAVNNARDGAALEGLLSPGEVKAAKEFDEARVQFVLAGMRLVNANADRNEMLAQAGYALGSMWANSLSAALGARERAIVNAQVQRSLTDHLGAGTAAKIIATVFKPETQH